MEADLYEEINGMIQLYLIRHSMTAGNLKKRYIGRTDESLCPEGIVLLKSYIQKNIYPEVQRVYVSPMKRCMETAKLIFKENFYEVEELRECDFGIFENKNYKELSDCPEYQAWIDSGGTMTFPGGENPEEFRKRCVRGFEKVIKECRHDQIKSVAVVAHGGTIMSIMDRYARDENGQPDGSYYDYQVKNGEGYDELTKTAQVIVDMLNTEAMTKVHVAFGTIVNEIKEVSRSYKEAKMAMDVGKIFYPDKNVIAYSRLGIGRLIYQLPLPLCKMFIKEIFDGRSPDEFDEETLQTINKFFENNLNVSETSRQLYIHRNTLVYRLDKLQKSTGLDLRVFEDAITFKIALMVVKYMKYMESIEY